MSAAIYESIVSCPCCQQSTAGQHEFRCPNVAPIGIGAATEPAWPAWFHLDYTDRDGYVTRCDRCGATHPLFERSRSLGGAGHREAARRAVGHQRCAPREVR